jgi:hypothetical protein
VSGGQIWKLAADHFIEAKRILNLTSGTGAGKTPLAIAVGVIRGPRQRAHLQSGRSRADPLTRD